MGEHRSELESDVPAADDDEAFRERVDVLQRFGVVDAAAELGTVDGWDVRDGSGVDDDGVGGDRHGVGAAGDTDLAFAGELGVAAHQQH